MSPLTPPYAVEVRRSRVLIVPARRFPQAMPPQPLCEALPYDIRSGDAEQRGAAIAAAINWHPELVEALGDLLREFSPPRMPRGNPAQNAALLLGLELLKRIRHA